jgi:hypothetical protein
VIVLAYGLPGTGKSALLHDLVATHATTHRVFCIDHEEGWGRGAIYWRGRPPEGLEVIASEKRLQEMENTEEADWPRAGVWVFRNLEPGRVAQLAQDKGDAVFVDDEIDTLARREGWEKSPLRRIAHEGRHIPNENGTPTRCHIMGACRRPQNLHIDVATLVDQAYVFRIQGHRTLKRLVDDSILNDDHLERIKNLPNLHFLHWPTWTLDESKAWLKLKPVGSKRRKPEPKPGEPLPSRDE